MNVFRPRSWKPIAAVGSRFYKARNIEVGQAPIPSEAETEFEKMRWTKAYSEKETTFQKLYKAFTLRKYDRPKTRLLADDFKYDNIRMYLKKRQKDRNLEMQSYRVDRHETLGNELAVAHFIVFRGGRIKFYQHDHWIQTEKNQEYYENLPRSFDPTMFVEAIDAQGMELMYEAFDNLKGLARMRWLSLNNSPLVDNWCLDKITAELRNSLEYLDISNCKRITYRGLTCLYKMDKLKTLIVENIADSIEFQLACLELEEAIPGLKIEGVNYIKPEQNESNIQ